MKPLTKGPASGVGDGMIKNPHGIVAEHFKPKLIEKEKSIHIIRKRISKSGMHSEY